jgi:1-acyl-sn-glycerol-3-phosphate acyltransferase
VNSFVRDLFGRIRAWLLLRPLAFLAARMRIEGFQGLPRGPWILACPLTSPYDACLIAAASRRPVHFLEMPSFRPPGLPAWLFRRPPPALQKLGSLESATFHRALHLLRQERIVGMFFNALEDGDAGDDASMASVSSLAQISGIPVRPCLILGSPQLAPWRLFEKRPEVRLIMGEPFTAFADLPPKAARIELERHLKDSIRELRGQAAQSAD